MGHELKAQVRDTFGLNITYTVLVVRQKSVLPQVADGTFGYLQLTNAR